MTNAALIDLQAPGALAAGGLPGAEAQPSWADQSTAAALPWLPPAPGGVLIEVGMLNWRSDTPALGGPAGSTGLGTPPTPVGIALLIGAALVLSGWRRARR